MSDFPTFVWPPLNTVTTFSWEALGQMKGTVVGSSPGSSVAFTANRVYYVQFAIFVPSTAVKMSYIVGATANGNVDLGIYDSEGNRLVNSGSTAQGTASTLQELDITDTLLTPGNYFMAITGSSGTGTAFVQQGANDEAVMCHYPVYGETPGAFGLPATAGWSVTNDAAPWHPAMAVHFDTLV